jgi:signal transduction histidine kinase
MSTSLTHVSETQLGKGKRPHEPLPARLLSVGVAALVVGILALDNLTIREALKANWQEGIFWVILLFVVNLFPVSVGEVTLTLDMPLLLTVALLYPAEFGALLAVIGAVDVRELRGNISPIRALFNRAQVGLVVLVASFSFHSVTEGLEPWPRAVLATVLATAAAYSLNVFLVALYMSLRQRVHFKTALSSLTVGRAAQFLATYLGYCVLALVLARLFRDVGEWSVITFLVPLVAAQQMLVRGQMLVRLTERLRSRERLLERLIDRIVDERRDERLRIAGDLHDEVLQNLTRVQMQSKELSRSLRSADRASSEAWELVRDSDMTLDALRRVIHDLRRSPLGRGGLIPTLQGLARDLQMDWRVCIEVDADEGLEASPELQVIAYQVAREGVMNALKHAEASHIRVGLRTEGRELLVAVEDDGRGFVVDSTNSSAHFGIGLMEERVRLMKGVLEVNSRLAKGTRVHARLPLTYQRRLEDLALRGRRIPPAPLAEAEKQNNT